IQSEVEKRAPGRNNLYSQRNEKDKVEFLSGIYKNKTLGTPIGFLVKNNDAKSKDYKYLTNIYRPGHADYTYIQKYGITDWRGGGRASARETLSRVVGGAFAKLFLKKFNIQIYAFTSQIGKSKLKINYSELDLLSTYQSPVRCPHSETSILFENNIKQVQKENDSIGGTISCVVKNLPIGLGEPVFDKFHSRLGQAILSINACKGFEIGQGFNVAEMKGSENNDQMRIINNKINFQSNNAGGVLGGITNGKDLFFKAAFKPTPTISKIQNTVTIDNKNIKIEAKGRHDACVVPRATIIVEAMTAMLIADFIFLNNRNPDP
ncbi:MAG: chorismate synthase, partial [Bacteroidota bacterium]|nr:chorismate synthase [Bacteroidota bacterium]